MKQNARTMIHDIPGWLTPREGAMLEAAARIYRGKPGVIVEIGSYLGKSTVRLAQSGDRVYAVDPHKGIFSGGKSGPTLGEFRKNLRLAQVDRVVHPIVKTSAGAVAAWCLPVKLLFIDGLHDELHADEDFTLWEPFVVPGGMVAMHDAFCGWEGAGNVAMKNIVHNPAYGEIGVVGSMIYGVKKRKTVPSRIIKVFRSLIIDLCQNIYRSTIVPKRIQYLLVHKGLKLLLVNRFSFVR